VTYQRPLEKKPGEPKRQINAARRVRRSSASKEISILRIRANLNNALLSVWSVNRAGSVLLIISPLSTA
jgi:hypothetical protein